MAESAGAKATLREKENVAKQIEFGLNPTQVSYSRAVKFDRPASEKAGDPTVQFKGVDPTSLTLALLLDCVGGRDTTAVQKQLDQLTTWTKVPRDAQSGNAGPPKLEFSWGSLSIAGEATFVGYLEQLKVTIEMFSRDGSPLRASVGLSLKSDVDSPGGQNPTSGAERSRRRRVLERGQTLQWLAYDEFGDAGAWRAVAELNGIDDPMRLAPGIEVLLPDRTELRAVHQ